MTECKTNERVVVVGWPGTGKSTLAAKLGGDVKCTDDVADLGWSEASEAASYWFDEPGPWVIEGVAVPRALRKWRNRNEGEPPPFDRMIILRSVHRELSEGAIRMGKGVDTVLRELWPWLQSVTIENGSHTRDTLDRNHSEDSLTIVAEVENEILVSQSTFESGMPY